MPGGLTLEQALLYAGIASAGAGVVGGLLGNKAINNAAQAQSDASAQAALINQQTAQQALGLQAGQYNDTVNRTLPWLDAGRAGLSSLTRLSGLNVQPSAPSNIQVPGVTSLPGYGGGSAGTNTINYGQPSPAPGSTGGGGGSKLGTVANYALGLAPFASKLAAGGGALAANVVGLTGLGVGALAGGAAAAIAIPWLKSQQHWEANDITKHFQEPFGNNFLAPLIAGIDSGQIPPDQALAQLNAGWAQYQSEIKKWAGDSSDRNQVMNQSLATIGPQIKVQQDKLAGKLQPQQAAAPAPAGPVQGASQVPTAQPFDLGFASRYRRA